MSRAALVAALFGLLAGSVFTAQGLGWIRGQSYLGRSFMVGDPTWAVIGAALVVGSLVVLWRVRPRRRPRT